MPLVSLREIALAASLMQRRIELAVRESFDVSVQDLVGLLKHRGVDLYISLRCMLQCVILLMMLIPSIIYRFDCIIISFLHIQRFVVVVINKE